MAEVDSCLDFLECLQQTADKPFIQAIETWICDHIVKQMREFLPSAVSVQIRTTKELLLLLSLQNTCE